MGSQTILFSKKAMPVADLVALITAEGYDVTVDAYADALTVRDHRSGREIFDVEISDDFTKPAYIFTDSAAYFDAEAADRIVNLIDRKIGLFEVRDPEALFKDEDPFDPAVEPVPLGWVPGAAEPLLPKIVKPKEKQLRALQLRFFFNRSAAGAHAATKYVEAAIRHFPEALPVKFGDGERLKFSFSLNDIARFNKMCVDELGIRMQCTLPVVGGAFYGTSPQGARPDLVGFLRVDLMAAPFAEPAWQARLRAFVIALAESLPAVYVEGNVSDGWKWERGVIYPAVSLPVLNVRGRLSGLSAYTPWLAWFGPDYLPHVAETLPSTLTTPTATGLLLQTAPTPSTADELPHWPTLVSPDLIPEPVHATATQIMIKTPARTIPDALL